ncbi:MAG: phosphatase PAP2 family protein [Bacteroidota bacterium]|nr:phosphatase PAP2 family protein [Bacteroidota bacterium]
MHKIYHYTIRFLLFSCIVVNILFSQSTYRISWSKESILLGSNIIAGYVAFTIDKTSPSLTLHEINQLSKASINWFDRSATYKYSEQIETVSNILVGLCVAAPVLLITDKRVQTDWTTFTLMYFETMMFASLTPLIVKGSVERIRPFAYNPNVPLEKKTTRDARRSFFSGHSTSAFASAVFFSTVYNDYFPNSEWTPYIFWGSLATASLVGFMRHESGQHFPTDVITGALIGSAIGYIIPMLHRVKNNDPTVSLSLGTMQCKVTLYLRN